MRRKTIKPYKGRGKKQENKSLPTFFEPNATWPGEKRGETAKPPDLTRKIQK